MATRTKTDERRDEVLHKVPQPGMTPREPQPLRAAEKTEIEDGRDTGRFSRLRGWIASRRTRDPGSRD